MRAIFFLLDKIIRCEVECMEQEFSWDNSESFFTPALGSSRSGAYYEITVSLCHSVTLSLRQEIDLLITRTVFNLEPPNLVCRFIVVVLIV